MAGGRRRYAINASEEASSQLRWLRRHDRDGANKVEDAIGARLSFEPMREDRNRKPLTGDTAGLWELRVHPFRVYYDVDEAAQVVTLVKLLRKPRETGTPLPRE